MTTQPTRLEVRANMQDHEIRKSMTSEQIRLERKLTCEAIDGAIAFGYQNTNQPPSDDHWLAPFWKIGRRQAELELLSASKPAAPHIETTDCEDCGTLGVSVGANCPRCGRLIAEPSDDVIDLAIALEQKRALHIVAAVRQQGFSKSMSAIPTQAESVFDLACEEIEHRLRTETWELAGVTGPLPAAPAQSADPALTLLKKLKRDLMHARRFGDDTLAAYRRACSEAEGEIESFLAAPQPSPTAVVLDDRNQDK